MIAPVHPRVIVVQIIQVAQVALAVAVIVIPVVHQVVLIKEDNKNGTQ
jgi:hypothetical protein